MKKQIYAVIICFNVLFCLTGCINTYKILKTDQSIQNAPYKNPHLPIEARVSDIIKQMALEEKI